MMGLADKIPTNKTTLADFCKRIELCESLQELTYIASLAARSLTRADGSSFIIREDDLCCYSDEDAISSLWKGKRFPLYSYVSGWAMVHNEVVTIGDIFTDGRVPLEAYKPTFVKSLLMIPITQQEAIGALGIYWLRKHNPDMLSY